MLELYSLNLEDLCINIFRAMKFGQHNYKASSYVLIFYAGVQQLHRNNKLMTKKQNVKSYLFLTYNLLHE